METSDRRKGETLGEAARRLLCRLDERAKTSGEMPEQIHEPGVSPCREKVTGAAHKGPPGAPVTVTCRYRGEENERQGWNPANDNRADFALYERGEAKQ